MHTTIEPLTLVWFFGTFATIAIIWLGIFLLKNQSSASLRKWEKGLIWFTLINEVAWQIYYFSTGTWDVGLSLPLHLCALSRLAGAFLLIRYNAYIFEFLILLGVGGALQSILTPEITVPYSWIAHIDYYVSHGLIIFFALYQLIVKERRIRPKSWLHAFLIGLLCLSIIAIFNQLTSSNYVYLCQKPIVDNPLLIGEWPYYLLSFLVFGFINILLFYFLFRWIGRRLTSKKPIL